MKLSTFGLRSSVFGLRSWVLGLLIFLFSANQIECTNQDKPAIKKQTSSNGSSRAWTGLKCVGVAAIVALLIWGGWTIGIQNDKIARQAQQVHMCNVLLHAKEHHFIQKQQSHHNRLCRTGAVINMGDKIELNNLPTLYVESIQIVDNENTQRYTFTEKKP